MEKEILSNKILKEANNLSNKNGAWVRPPKDQIKTILVENCQTCPFCNNDNEFGANFCNLNMDVYGVNYSELPENQIHDKCPLKNMNHRIRLK